MVKTYQDYEEAVKNNDLAKFISDAINEWKSSILYKDALIADKYDSGYNVTIKTYQKFLYDTMGNKYKDIYSADNKISNRFYPNMVTDIVQYSLANGIEWADTNISKQLASNFDTKVKKIAKYAVKHSVCYAYIDNDNNVDALPITSFVPLKDENTNVLRAGIKWYQLDQTKPFNAILYTDKGYIEFKGDSQSQLQQVDEIKSYVYTISSTEAEGVIDRTGIETTTLPIVELYYSDKTSLDLVRDKIDAYDLTLSGFANDIDENAFIYWIVENAGGMEDKDLARFKQALRTSKIANVDSDDGTKVSHFQNDVPTEARTKMLDRLTEQMYLDSGTVNIDKLSQGNVTATAIRASYHAMDNRASEFEDNIKTFLIKVLEIMGIEVTDYTITFIRNRIVNDLEEAQTQQMKVNTISSIAASQLISEETALDTIKQIIPELASIDTMEELKKIDLSSNNME